MVKPSVLPSLTTVVFDVGMVLQEDLRRANGMLIMAANHELTWPMLLRLRSMLGQVERRRMIRVLAPKPLTLEASLPVLS